MTEFFTDNIIAVFFFYGLSFFSMGLAVLLEIGRASESDFAMALRPLAGFGIIHGGHEWFEMGMLIHQHLTGDPTYIWVSPLRVMLLAISFLMLVMFGARLIVGPGKIHVKWSMFLVVAGLWAIGLIMIMKAHVSDSEGFIAADVYTRYSLAIPGAALTTWGLLLQRRKFEKASMPRFGLDVTLAAVTFALYGGIGQLFASPSTVFPSGYLNAEVFLRWFGFPIQVFRALMAFFSAVFIIRSLRSFDEDNRRRIEALREAQLAEQKRIETLRAELLHRTVQAQESERRRIARELHDETGQTFTALGMGLRGLSESISANPEKAIQQARQLETLATGGIQGLQHLVAGLHPPQLDELGLPAALRWYAGQVKDLYGLPISVICSGQGPALPPEVRTTLFRITQEAITNSVRHAKATQASIVLEQLEKHIILRIEDNGRGFDVDTVIYGRQKQCWGLLGVIERAELMGGTCQIRSRIGMGTVIDVSVQLV